ncbi:MAG: lysophospholipid acyltransferase family protein [Candidatus Binatia bacterium]
MLKFFARWFLKLSGWEAVGARPRERRFVLIAAPHTTNWDLAYLLAFAATFDVKISWMGKDTLFRPPLGWLMRRLGGIAIDRRRRGNIVSHMARAFEESESLALVVPAEGTRKHVPYWKSGFYHIASSADVPIVPAYLDYARRQGGFGPALRPTGNLRSDMDKIREFYADKVGKYPDQGGDIRLREEG